MPTEGTDSERGRDDIRTALREALARLGAEDGPEALEAVDYHWLGIGLRLGTGDPETARGILALVDASEAGQMTPVDEAARGARQATSEGTGNPDDRPTVDFRSTLLARSATLPLSELTGPDPQSTFSWVAAMTAREILSIGRVVDEMLATGSPPDISRGFGMAWDAGVRLPREELEAMIGEFAELQVAVGGVLAGRDLRGAAAERRRGVSGWLDPWLTRTSQAETQASVVIQASGESAQHGLVALWNAWVAVRYRTLIPPSTFELLVLPWRTVMGPLSSPEAARESPSIEELRPG